jgi:hypothetical protein
VFTDEGYTIAVTGARITLLVVRDLIYIGFSAALAYIFRLRESNPYYMLDDYNTNLFDDDDNEGEVCAGDGQQRKQSRCRISCRSKYHK